MPANRREVLEGTLAFAVRIAIGGGLATTLSSCGSSSSSASTPAPSNLSYSTPATATVGMAMSQLTPSVNGGVTSYSISPALPAGLTFNTQTGVISGTPTAATAQTTYTITASNSGGTTSFPLSLTVIDALAISSVSNATPTALTPVTLSMKGLDPSKPFTVNLSNGVDVNAQIQPVRTASDGSAVVVAAPMYIDPNTGATGGLNASVTVTQGSQTSNSVQLSISDMPSVASYGVNPGDISRGFLNQLALGFALNVNALQAVAALPSATTDTSIVRTHLKQQQLAALEARDNIDVLLSGAQPNLPVGTTSTGQAVQFNMQSIDAMDRVLGMYLQYLRLIPSSIYAPLSTAAGASIKRASEGQASRGGPRMPTLKVTRPPAVMDMVAAAPVGGGPTNQIPSNVILNLGTSSGQIAESNASIVAASAQLTPDEVKAIGQAVVAGVALAGSATGATELAAGAVIVGTAMGAAAMGNDVYKWHTASNAINDALNSGDPTQLAQAQQQKTTAMNNLGLDTAETLLGVTGLPAETAGSLGFGADVINTLMNVQTGTGGVVVQGTSLITSLTPLLTTTSSESDEQTVSNSNGDIASGSGSFGLINGNVIVQNNAGAGLLPLNGVLLYDPATGNTFETSAGTDNSYQMLVPLNVPGMDYSQMQLAPFDPVSSYTNGTLQELGTALTVNLSALSAGSAQTEPTVNGSCNEDDSTSPDQDDPDCD